jgi:hypothetical protein
MQNFHQVSDTNFRVPNEDSGCCLSGAIRRVQSAQSRASIFNTINENHFQ